jgi:hypothetical protein
MKALLIAIAMCMGLAGAAHAQGKTIRYPAQGSPSFNVTLPEAWTSQIDSSDNLIVSSASKTVSFSMSWIEDRRELDALAAEAFELAGATKPFFGGALAFQPSVAGKLFFSTLTISNQTLNARMAMARIDSDHVAAATMVSRQSAPPADLAEAERVQQSIRIN